MISKGVYVIGVSEDFVQDFDIVCLSETKCKSTEDLECISGFQFFVIPVRNLKRKYGGAHGICVYVRSALPNQIEVIGDSCWEFVFWLKYNDNMLCTPFILCVVYLPCEGSHFHHNEVFDN